MPSAVATAVPQDYLQAGDKSPSPTRQKAAEAIDKLWTEYLANNKLELQEQYSGEGSLKAARVLGEYQLAMPASSASKLSQKGIFATTKSTDKTDAECVRLANKQLYLDKKRRRDLHDQHIAASVLGVATPLQLEIPSTTTAKALQLLGDADHLAPVKARAVLGSTSAVEDETCRLAADRQWQEDMLKRAHDFTARVLLQRPTASVLEIQAPVSDKALAFFGEEQLEQQSKLQVKPDRVRPKAVQVFGEPYLAGKKAESMLLGDAETVVNSRRASLV